MKAWKRKEICVNAWNDLHPWCAKSSKFLREFMKMENKFREYVKWHIFVCVLLRAVPIFLSVRECEFKINRRRNHINCLKFLKFSISQDFDYLTLKICIFTTCLLKNKEEYDVMKRVLFSICTLYLLYIVFCYVKW